MLLAPESCGIDTHSAFGQDISLQDGYRPLIHFLACRMSLPFGAGVGRTFDAAHVVRRGCTAALCFCDYRHENVMYTTALLLYKLS